MIYLLNRDYLSTQISSCFSHDPGWSTHLRGGHSGGMGFPPSRWSLSLILMHRTPDNIPIQKATGSCIRLNWIGIMEKKKKHTKQHLQQLNHELNLTDTIPTPIQYWYWCTVLTCTVLAKQIKHTFIAFLLCCFTNNYNSECAMFSHQAVYHLDKSTHLSALSQEIHQICCIWPVMTSLLTVEQHCRVEWSQQIKLLMCTLWLK